MARLNEFAANALQHAQENGGDFASFPELDLLQEELGVEPTGELDAATILALATVYENAVPGVEQIPVHTEDSAIDAAAYYAVAAPLIQRANDLVDITIERSSGKATGSDGLGNEFTTYNRGTAFESLAVNCENGAVLSQEQKEALKDTLNEVEKENRTFIGSFTGSNNVLDHDLQSPNPIAAACDAEASIER